MPNLEYKYQYKFLPKYGKHNSTLQQFESENQTSEYLYLSLFSTDTCLFAPVAS